MASKQEKCRLKQHICEIETHHRNELTIWTRKCGRLGNEIGNLRKQLAEQQSGLETHHQAALSFWTKKCGDLGNEVGQLRKQLAEEQSDLETNHQAALSFWTKKCGDLGNEVGRLRKQLAEKEEELEAEHQATLRSWIERCGEVCNEIARLRKELLNNEILYQSERAQAKHEIDDLRQRCEKLEIELQTDVVKQRIDCDLTALIDREVEVIVESPDICEQCDSGHINDIEADHIVHTYCSSDGETDEVNHVNESVEIDEVRSGSITEEDDVIPIVTDHQVQQPDEVLKQKPKFMFWTTLKRHVSMKGKMGKSSTLTYKVNGTD